MSHGIFLFDLTPRLIDIHSKLQLVVDPVLLRNRQRKLAWFVCQTRPWFHKQDRFFGNLLSSHFLDMLEVVFTHANYVRKGFLSVSHEGHLS